MTEKVLLVDDDPNVLSGYSRQLRRQFEVVTVEGAQAALERMHSEGPFAVVVSDQQMPDISGVEFLKTIANHFPATIRIMLTGNADQQTAIEAVNQGKIFRFLCKPCSPEDLAKTIEAAIGQFKLQRTEHELLARTLSGSVNLMTEVLSLVNPKAFGRASRLRTLAKKICIVLQHENSWEVEIAAMLSQTGCIIVPEAPLEKLFEGEPLTTNELALIDRHPKVGADLVNRIPRLEGAAKLIALQNARLDSGGHVGETQPPPMGARILKVIIDYDVLCGQIGPADALDKILTGRPGWYDVDVCNALAEIVEEAFVVQQLWVKDLKQGMIFDEHVQTQSGAILIARGQEINETLLWRLQNFERAPLGVRQPIRVRCYEGVFDTLVEQQ